MSRLELKIPPALLVLLFAVAMYSLSTATGNTRSTGGITSALAVTCALAGILVSLAGVVQFRRARTTVNPVTPTASSSLVTSGIYRFSRNPMYLGFLLILTGWALFLANMYAAALIPLFVLYMNRFQIIPEERALLRIFGQEFANYISRVGRWF
jgi:protein-S-isoprenylcysteine O-methyltransferase Ste14